MLITHAVCTRLLFYSILLLYYIPNRSPSLLSQRPPLPPCPQRTCSRPRVFYHPHRCRRRRRRPDRALPTARTEAPITASATIGLLITRHRRLIQVRIPRLCRRRQKVLPSTPTRTSTSTRYPRSPPYHQAYSSRPARAHLILSPDSWTTNTMAS